MVNKYIVTDKIDLVFSGKKPTPTTVLWNRLEGRPRRADFSRALQAELRDPLWLLTRQWQMGEFIGEDAGSPITAKLAWRTDSVTHISDPAGVTAGYDPSLPLEAIVEARPLDLVRNGRPHNVQLRAQFGRRWERMLTAAGHGAHIPLFRTTYAFAAPDPALKSQFELTAAPANWQMLEALAGRITDGGALYLLLKSGGAASDGLGLAAPDAAAIDALGDQLVAWADKTFYQSDDGLENWQPGHIEYGVALNAPEAGAPAALSAGEYHGGRLDWYHFDAAAPAAAPGPAPAAPPLEVTSFIPTPAQFEGMPNTRHWTFEEGLVNFGDIAPDTTDIAKLLLIEFGLVFANDWFLVPMELPVGSLTRIAGLAVTNVFGERTWIEPAVDPAGPVRSWQMFRLSDKGRKDARLFLPAATPTGLESHVVEAVDLIRDEVSNMVWAIEQTVQLADGSSRRGREVGLELRARYQAAVPVAAPPAANDAKVRYELMTSVPENWIPFIPVGVQGSNHEVQLQRASMPRLLEGTQGIIPDKVKPVTAFIREGLDAPVPAPYLLAEEEVVRAGTRLESRWQRCRWRDGRVVTWLGYRRRTGRGEGNSGLAFDQLLPKQPR